MAKQREFNNNKAIDIDDLLESYLLEIPLVEWQPCHREFFSRKISVYQQDIETVLSKMFKTQSYKVFNYQPEDRVGEIKITPIRSYFDLMTITQDLHICTAVRQDLVLGFNSGIHLRWKMTINDMTVGVIGFFYTESNFGRCNHKVNFNGRVFDVYALGHNHKFLNDKSSEAKAFNKFIDRHGQQIADSVNELSAQLALEEIKIETERINQEWLNK